MKSQTLLLNSLFSCLTRKYYVISKNKVDGSANRGYKVSVVFFCIFLSKSTINYYEKFKPDLTYVIGQDDKW